MFPIISINLTKHAKKCLLKLKLTKVAGPVSCTSVLQAGLLKLHTFTDQFLDSVPHSIILLSEPACEESDFHIDEPFTWITDQLRDNTVQNVLHL